MEGGREKDEKSKSDTSLLLISLTLQETLVL